MITRATDGSGWPIGTEADVAWIASGTSMGRTITAAIPPVFEAYAIPAAGPGSVRRGEEETAVAEPALEG